MIDFHRLLSRYTNKPGGEIPPLDGAYQPNDALDKAKVIYEKPDMDNVISAGAWLYFSSGRDVYRIKESGKAEHLSREQDLITCLAFVDEKTIAVGVANHGVKFIGGAHGDLQIRELSGHQLAYVSAVLSIGNGLFVIANASSSHGPNEWTKDLLLRSKSGFIGTLQLESNQGKILASGLSHVGGLELDVPGKNVIFTEGWNHSISSIPLEGSANQIKVLMPNLPGYPFRICRSEDDGYWFSMIALRTQLFEFVQSQTRYRDRMIAEIDPQYWVAPSLGRDETHLHPLQQGSVKKLGIVKAWAPPRSYGIIVKVSDQFIPQASLHSRANGYHHGISSLTIHKKNIIYTSKGSGKLLMTHLSELEVKP